MAPTTRRSARVSIQDGGIPLPAGHTDAYGENNEIAPVKGGKQQAIEESENNDNNTELYNETFSLGSGGQRQNWQSQRNQQNQQSWQAKEAQNTHDTQHTQHTQYTRDTNRTQRYHQAHRGQQAQNSQQIQAGQPIQQTQQTQQYQQTHRPLQINNPIGEAISNINKPILRKNTSSRDASLSSPPGTRVPTKGSRPAFPENHRLSINNDDPWNLRDEEGNRNLYKTSLQNPYQTPYNGRLHPSEPLNSLVSKWGMASGRPSPYPLSTRSFMQEEWIYDKANIETPSIPPPPKRQPQQVKKSADPTPPSVAESARPEPLAPSSESLEVDDRSSRTNTVNTSTNQGRDPSSKDTTVNGSHGTRTTGPTTNGVNSGNISSVSGRTSMRMDDRDDHRSSNTATTNDSNETRRSDLTSDLVEDKSPPKTESDKHWMDHGLINTLREKMGTTNPPLENDRKPWTSRDDLTQAQKDQAEELRDRMRIDKGPVGVSPPWEKPPPPTYSPVQNTVEDKGSTNTGPSIVPVGSSPPWEKPPPSSSRHVRNTVGNKNRTNTGPGIAPGTTPSNKITPGPGAGRGTRDEITPPSPKPFDGSRNQSSSRNNSIGGSEDISSVSGNHSWSHTTTTTKDSTGSGLRWRTGSRLLSPRDGNINSPETDYIGPVGVGRPDGSSWSRLVSQARQSGSRVWSLAKRFGGLALLLMLLAVLLPFLRNLWFSGGASLPISTSRFALPSWGGCCVDTKLKNVFHRLDGIDLDLNRIHGTLDAFKLGIAPADDGRRVFWVERDSNGKLMIPQDYYEAIKQQILKDKDLLKGVSNATWSPVINRLVADGYLHSKPSGNFPDFSEIEIDNVNNAWNLWVRQNDAAIVKALHGELNRTIAELTEKELKDLLARRNVDLADGKLVTHKEFEELYKKEIKSSYGEKLRELADQVEDFKDKLATKLPHGFSKEEFALVIEAAVRKYADALKIEAVAKSGSTAILTRLTGQINYFSTGSGAVIDPHFTSPRWNPPRPAFKSKQWYDKDGYVPQSPLAAILPWEEEGECFCAGPNIRGQGIGTANVSIMVSRDIVPQVIILEHILPGATLDPGARPRDIEIWAQYEDYHLRQTVEAWSRGRWPATVKEKVLPGNFIKIDEFTYEDHKVGDGAQLHKINSELVDMDAATSVFVVRALNNYGADHTCFYRIRMYGEQRDRDLGV